MNGNDKVILDSNVIIYISKLLLNPAKLLQSYNEFYVSIITYIEVLGYSFTNPAEKQRIEDLFNILIILEVNIPIADFAKSYRATHKIKTPDAIILASAKFIEADLVTNNISDFQNVDNTINLLDLTNF